MKKVIFPIFLLISMALCPADAGAMDWLSIKPDRARLLQKESGDVWLVDIRNHDNFSGGHIEGSLNIPAELLRIKQFPKGKRLILIDDSIGQITAKKSAQSLSGKELRISVLEGGIRQWRRDGHPLTKDLPDIGVVTPVELREVFENKSQLRILDLRADDEFRNGSLPGAELIKGADIFEKITALKKLVEKQAVESRKNPEKMSPVILILSKGQDSQLLEKNIEADNLEIRYLLGGLEAWASSFGGREQKTVGSCPYCTTKTQINR